MHFSTISMCCVLGLAFMLADSASAKDEPFKVNKLNLIWTKAQHSLGQNKLKDLRDDLLNHELDELKLKKMKAHQQDKDGLVEATVKRKLQSIMKKYALERYYDDIHQSASNKPKEFNRKLEGPVEVATFRDSKLDKLWKKAEKAGFSAEEMMMFHQEFEQQEAKVDDHYRTAHIIEEEIEKTQKEAKMENTIEADSVGQEDSQKKKISPEKLRETPAEKKARLEANAQQALREKHSKIKKGYDELHQKIKSGSINPNAPFKEKRINELWNIIVKSNFTKEELETIKEELEHYQIRIEKLKHFQNQLERHRIGTKDYSTNANEDEEAKHLRRRVKELSQKVEKADRTIVSKFVKDEL